MSEWPLVSIINAVCNGADMIQRTIDSIQQQDYPHIEHIVMDAGSLDGTLDILRAHKDHLTWYSEADKGQSDALNKGFALTKGNYLSWLNADDFLYPASITRCLKVFEENPNTVLVYGRINHVHRDGSYWR